MDPPPPSPGSTVAAASTAAIPPAAAAAAAAAAAGPSRLLATAHIHNHPSYDDMIFAAVSAMESATGPSTKMISDYIEKNYRDLPPNHSALLTHHLDIMTESGRIVVSQSSYRVPKPEGSGHPKRGRPAKTKLVSNPALSDDKAWKTDEVAEPRLPKRGRGRGRPAKVRGRGPVEEAALQGTPKKARGRPPKVTMVPFAGEDADAETGIGPQDQPEVTVGRVRKSAVRRRGRPPRSNATTAAPTDQPNPSGPSAASVAAMHVHGLEYQILRKKVEIIQGKIKDAVAVLKAHFGKGSDDVTSAIRELEAIAAMDMKAFQMVDSS